MSNISSHVDFASALDSALQSVFKDYERGGYWSEPAGAIVRSALQDKEGRLYPTPAVDTRYSSFCLMSILYWRWLNKETSYDSYLKRHVAYLKGQLKAELFSKDWFYGNFTSLAFASHFWGDREAFEVCMKMFRSIPNRTRPRIRDNQQFLRLWALSWFYELHPQERGTVHFKQMAEYIDSLARFCVASQDKNGFFQTGDIRALHHQRTLYALWGLAKVVAVFGSRHLLPSIEKSLDHIWEHRRASDNAFLWHPSAYMAKAWLGFPIPVFLPRSARYLFECHQTFFANTCAFYAMAGGNECYSRKAVAAMDWIFGENRLGANLPGLTGLNIPPRMMDLAGNIYIRGNRFKGSYEIGSYIMALANLVKLQWL